MQRRSFGKQMWRLFGPLIIKGCIGFGVEFVALTLYMLPHMPELLPLAQDKEAYFVKVTEIAYELAQHGTELAALTAIVAIPVLAWMFRRDRKREKEQGKEMVTNKVSLWKYLFVIGISIPFALGVNNILMLANLTEISEAYKEASKVLYTPSFPVQILCLGIIIPLMEELIFRGLLFKRIREDAPFLRAMIYSSLFFGLYHGNTVQVVYGIVCGALFAYLYEAYHSFKAPVLAHMVMNILVCTVTEADGFRWMFAQPMRMGVITVVCAAVASSMFVLIREKISQ